MRDPNVPRKENYTAERLIEFWPEKVELAVNMLAKGEKTSKVAKTIKTDQRRVKSIAILKKDEIIKERERLMGLAMMGARQAGMKAIEEIPNVKGRDAAVMHGIFMDSISKLEAIQTPPQPQLHVHVDVVENFKKILEAANQQAEKVVTATEVPQLPE